jgi:nicotinamidase-related amidase
MSGRQPFKLFSIPTPFKLTDVESALIVCDPQKLTMSRTGYYARLARKKGVEKELGYYFASLPTTMKNIKKLLSFFRKTKLTIIFTRFYWQDSPDSLTQSHHPMFDPKEFVEEDFRFLEDLKPKNEEIVLNKICENPFNCTEIDNLLRSLKVNHIIICGVRTPGYLDTMALDATDRGFKVTVVSDSCTGGSRNGPSNLISSQIHVRYTHTLINEFTSEQICYE